MNVMKRFRSPIILKKKIDRKKCLLKVVAWCITMFPIQQVDFGWTENAGRDENIPSPTAVGTQKTTTTTTTEIQLLQKTRMTFCASHSRVELRIGSRAPKIHPYTKFKQKCKKRAFQVGECVHELRQSEHILAERCYSSYLYRRLRITSSTNPLGLGGGGEEENGRLTPLGQGGEGGGVKK